MAGGHRRSWGPPQVAGLIALVLASAAYLGAAFWPYAYRGETIATRADGTVVESTTHASSIAVNGAWVLGVLAVPLALAAGAFVAALFGRRMLVWAFALTLLAFSTVAMASVGLFFMPSVIALIFAAALLHRVRPASDSIS
jgi:hypothetical protein